MWFNLKRLALSTKSTCSGPVLPFKHKISKPQNVKEVCPNCGEFVDQLIPYTGWCFDCSKERILGNFDDLKVCPHCEKRFIDRGHKMCRICRRVHFLANHADEIDKQLATGKNLTRAIEIVKKQNVTVCLSCGEVMKKATRGVAFFCRKGKCRSAYNKLHRLIYVKHVPRERALEIVLEGIHGSKTSESTESQA